MKILLLGANGQVGWELQRSLAPLGELMVCDRHAIDLANLDGLKEIVREYVPHVIVNAAAYTAVDKAESEQEKAYEINAVAVNLLASEAKRLKAWLFHYSTDYVFDGTKSSAYTEIDEPNPLSVYGKSKLAGEEAVKKSGCMYIIFRTSWVYSVRGHNFVKTILRLAKEKDDLRIIADQYGAPTSAVLIADITALCLYYLTTCDKLTASRLIGIYHLASANETSWHGFAKFIIKELRNNGYPLRVSPDNIQPISFSEYSSIAKRPSNSRLDTKKLTDTFGVYLPHWRYHVKRLISELVEHKKT